MQPGISLNLSTNISPPVKPWWWLSHLFSLLFVDKDTNCHTGRQQHPAQPGFALPGSDNPASAMPTSTPRARGMATSSCFPQVTLHPMSAHTPHNLNLSAQKCPNPFLHSSQYLGLLISPNHLELVSDPEFMSFSFLPMCWSNPGF